MMRIRKILVSSVPELVQKFLKAIIQIFGQKRQINSFRTVCIDDTNNI